jgi:molybdopterin/thiamine biosynthesis adenylyltransferase/rhodanese-related sulfurtransferase
MSRLYYHEAMKLDPVEMQRYSRHLSLPQVGESGQLMLKKAKVLIVGAGGLGCPVALYLAAAGVGHLCLVDHDRVDLSNLQRQILFSVLDIGELKAKCARRKLLDLNPNIRVDALNEKLDEINARHLIRQFDLVIDGTDNFKTRYLINDICVEENKPFVFGALSRFDAQLAVFHFREGPCYRCLYPIAPPLEAVANCADAGVLGVLPGTIGTLMATEAIKIILEIGEPISSMILTYDALRSEIFKRRLSRNPKCPTCASERKKIPATEFHLSEVQPGSTISEYFILDVRSSEEFGEGHLPKAKNIELRELKNRIIEVPKNEKILLVCKSGQRSQRAAEILQGSGYGRLFNFAGGMDAHSLAIKET